MVNAIKLLTVMAIGFLLVACDQKWSKDDKENARHFVNSIELVLQAHSISNSGVSDTVSQSDISQVLSLYEHALSESGKVTDDVLEKAHSELPKHYRLYFQKGLELRIKNLKEYKPYDEIQGSALMDSWGDWFEKNRQNIRIPR